MESEFAATSQSINACAGLSKQQDIPAELQKLLGTSIERTSLSTRIKNICWNSYINTVSDLTNYSSADFAKLRNAGMKSANEVEAFLKNNGLSWKM